MRGEVMAISYKKLFKLLIDRDLKKKELRDMTGISYATLHKLERGENIMTDVLNNICSTLHCGLNDIAEYIPEKPTEIAAYEETTSDSGA